MSSAAARLGLKLFDAALQDVAEALATPDLQSHDEMVLNDLKEKIEQGKEQHRKEGERKRKREEDDVPFLQLRQNTRSPSEIRSIVPRSIQEKEVKEEKEEEEDDMTFGQLLQKHKKVKKETQPVKQTPVVPPKQQTTKSLVPKTKKEPGIKKEEIKKEEESISLEDLVELSWQVVKGVNVCAW